MARLARRPAPSLLATLVVLVSLATAGIVGSAGAFGATATRRYVALGDSYTAGPLIPLQQKRADIPGACLQSDHNYPHLVQQRLQLPEFADASCSGAQTDDMTQPQGVDPDGPNPPQFDRLTAQTKVVTIGIGGNDIGFTDIAETCGKLAVQDPNGQPCHDHYVVNGDDQVADRIAALAPDLAAVLDGIHTRAPNAKVFVVGYPAILPDTGDGCYPIMPVAKGDVPWVRGIEKNLNGTIKSVAGAHRSVFVDTYTPSIGHDACQLETVKWVEPVVPTAPAAPVHPNARGEAGMAAAVAESMQAHGVTLAPAP
jgi:lysophospholipase L1-like esterase